MVENLCKFCILCLLFVFVNKIELLRMLKLLNKLWLEVSVDFCGFFLFGEYLLVVIDDYLRYLEIEIVYLILVRLIMMKLDKIFFIYGILNIVKIDNGFLF